MRAQAWVVGLAGLWTVPSLPTCLNVYRSDVERICNAEQRSGKTVKADAAGVKDWIERNVASGPAVVLEGQLASESPHDRAVHLRTEARNESIGTCPLADSYEAYAVEDDYKTAVAALCDGKTVTEGGDVARLDVAPADDAERIREIRDWTLTTLKGAEALALVDRLAQTAAQGRPAMLRAEASKVGITSCALAAILEHPPPVPLAEVYVALPSFTVTHGDAPAKVQEGISALLLIGTPAQTVANCYGPALVKTPALAGTVSLRLTFDPKGKVAKGEETASSLGNPAIGKCIASGLAGELLIPEKAAGNGVKYTVTLSLAPARGIKPPGWPSVMPPPLTTSQGVPLDAGAPDAATPDAGRKKKGGR